MEHKICKDCQYNNYPACTGTKMPSGLFMNIENLKPSFQCGQKDTDKMTDFSIIVKSELEFRVEVLEAAKKG